MVTKSENKSESAKVVSSSESAGAESRCVNRGFGGRHKQLWLSVLLLLFGIVLAVTLVKLRKPPKRSIPKRLAPLVKVKRLHAQDVEMVVTGYGTVTPSVEVEIVPQVSGKIIWTNPEFKPGGFIRANEELFRIDPRDYELAVEQADAVVAEAVVKLDLEKAEAAVSRKEWEQLHPDSEPTSPLVLREPQIRQAEANLKAAQARLAVARLNLERTRLSLPIDARIMSETADLGQFVTAGRAVGSAYGTEAVEIELPLEDKELAWFDIPDGLVQLNGDEVSNRLTPAEVRAEFAGKVHTWKGYVTRTTGQVDRKSRLISVVVEVPHPFDKGVGRVPLLPGVFVEVSIKGNMLRNVMLVPRDAVRDGEKVWVLNGEHLHIQDLQIVRRDKDFVYVTDGIKDGASIITSSLDTVTEGMRVRGQWGLARSQGGRSDVNQPGQTEAD